MSVVAFSGPIVTYQDGGILANTSANQNPDQGPSMFLQGNALLDPRQQYTYFPSDPNGLIGFNASGAAIVAAPSVGFFNVEVLGADFAPSTVSTTNIAASQAVSSTGGLTLVSATGSGITVGDSITNAVTGATVTGLLRIDNTPAILTFGQAQTLGVWDPSNPPVGRAVSLTSASNLSAINFTVAGYDAYGYPQTQTLAGPNANTVNTTKTFKWIASVKPASTSGSSVSVGTADIYGLPLRSDRFFYASDSCWNNALILTAAFTAADTTSPATASTGDVRGTITTVSSSDGTKRLQIYQSVAPANVSTVTGLFGVTPA